jgi:hypothetical protein
VQPAASFSLRKYSRSVRQRGEAAGQEMIASHVRCRLDVIGDLAPACAVGRITQPLENRPSLPLFGCHQVVQQTRHRLGSELRGHPLGQYMLRVTQHGAHEKCDTPFSGQHIAEFIEPNPRHPGQLVATERCLHRATQMCRQTALSGIRQMAEAQRAHRNVLMIEERALAAVQGPDRRQAWAELCADMFENGNGKNLIRVQHAPGHPQVTDLQRDAQPVQGTASRCHRRQLVAAQCEELVDLGIRG